MIINPFSILSSYESDYEELEFEESDPAVVFQANLTNLHENLPKECVILYSRLRYLYLTDPTNEIVRKSLHLSIVGTIWTEALKILPSIMTVPNVFELKDAPDIWAEVDTQAKTEIINRIQKYLLQPSTSDNMHELWKTLFEKLINGICGCDGRDYKKMLDCLPHHATTKMPSYMRKMYNTDIVFSAGSFAIPLLMVEIGDESANSSGIHKDTRKLAFQMGEVLLHLIADLRIRRKGEESLALIPNLRVFGALISGTQIQFCISRPQLISDENFVIIFETKLQDQGWTFDLCKGNHSSTLTPFKDIPLPVNMTETDDRFKDLLPVFASLNIYEAKSENRAVSTVSMVVESVRKVDTDAISSVAKFVDFAFSYYNNLADLVAYIYLDCGVSDNTLLFSPVLPVGTYPRKKNPCIESTPFDIVPIDAPIQYIFPTLPTVRFTKPFQPEPSLFRCDQYIENYNLTQLERWFEKKYAETVELSINRILLRAHFIVGISMALYKAHQAGLVFETLEFEDITFRDHSFCIKTYNHVVSLANPSAPTLADSFKAFSAVYYSFWFYDSYMTEGDKAYDALRCLEWSSFGKMREAEENHFDWSDFFTKVLENYEAIEKNDSSHETLFLLKHMMNADNLHNEKLN